LPTSVNIEYQ